MKMEKINVYIPPLKIFPNSLLVDNNELASGKSLTSTKVNTYLLFGAENNPAPIPYKIQAKIRYSNSK